MTENYFPKSNPREKREWRKTKAGATKSFYLDLKTNSHHFCSILFVTQTNPGTMGEWLAQRHEC